MGTIIIRDETMGTSKAFQPTREGYYAAKAEIERIIYLGHNPGGDVGRVLAFTG